MSNVVVFLDPKTLAIILAKCSAFLLAAVEVQMLPACTYS